MNIPAPRETRLDKPVRNRRTRSEIAAQLPSFSELPAPDLSEIAEADRPTYAARVAAVKMWIDGEPELAIKQTTGLTALATRRLVERASHRDKITDKPLGLFVCNPGFATQDRAKPIRRKPFDPILAGEGKGQSGTLADCFSKYPSIQSQMVEFVTGRRVGGAPPVALLTRLSVIQAFHAACRNHGLHERGEYPFNKKRRGENAIWEWYRNGRWTNSHIQTRNEQGDEAANLAKRDQAAAGHEKSREYPIAFDRVEFDEHRTHAHFAVFTPTASGHLIACGTLRPWVLAIVDTANWVCIASCISFKQRYDFNDMRRLLLRAVCPPKPLRLTITNLNFQYVNGAAFPAETLGPRLWREIGLDADASHLGSQSLHVAKDLLKFNIASERVGDPTARPFVEGYFSTVAEYLAQLPCSTGSHPQDPAKRSGPESAKQHAITTTLLEELLDVYSRNWNATAKAATGGISPLERMKEQILSQHAYHLPMPPSLAGRLWQLLPKHSVKITRSRGNSGTFQVNFHGRYVSRDLTACHELAYLRDTGAMLYVQEDARFAHLVPSERPNLNIPVVLKDEFSAFPHSLELRRLCRAAKRNAGIAGRADSPQLVMGVLQGLGEAARSSEPALAVMAGLLSFMNRHGLGNCDYVDLPAAVRAQLLDFAKLEDLSDNDSDSAAAAPVQSENTAANSPISFGNL